MATRRRTRRCSVAAFPGRRHTAAVLRTTLIYSLLLALLAVGLLVSLISAAVLRNSRVLPARAT